MQIQAKIQGTRPLLMHSGALVDPQNDFVKAIKKISAKKPKTDADQAEIARLEFLGAVYVDDSGSIVLPDVNIMSAIVAGARKSSRGKDAQAGVFVDGHGTFDFSFSGKKTPEALWESGKFIDRRAVVIQRSKIMRVRPRFDKWSSSFTLEIDDTVCNAEAVRDWLETAGNRRGIGDFRPMYGRFKVVEFKPEKEKK